MRVWVIFQTKLKNLFSKTHKLSDIVIIYTLIIKSCRLEKYKTIIVSLLFRFTQSLKD